MEKSDRKHLSIMLLCYNHEKYIKQCLDSIFDQLTTYNFVVYASDDASTDASREILVEYQKKYPDHIELILPQNNVGVCASFMACYEKITTPYYCILEGDDFWCDATKIQKQIDVLEDNPTLVGCTHNFYILQNKTGEMNVSIHSPIESEISFEAFLTHPYFHTSTYIWRHIYPMSSGGLPSYLGRYKECSGDFLHSVAHVSQGKIAYINRIMSVYRIHDRGMWQQLDKATQTLRNITLNLYINEIFEGKYKKEIINRWKDFQWIIRLALNFPLSFEHKKKIIDWITRKERIKRLICLLAILMHRTICYIKTRAFIQ